MTWVGRRFHCSARDASVKSGITEPDPPEISSGISASLSSRLHFYLLEAQPPSGVVSRSPMTTATSFRRRPTNCLRSTSTVCDPCRTQATEASGSAVWKTVVANTTKWPSQEVSGVSGNSLRMPRPLPPRRASRSSAGRHLRKCYCPFCPLVRLKLASVAAGAARLFLRGTSHHQMVMIDKTTKRWRDVVVEGLKMPTCEV